MRTFCIYKDSDGIKCRNYAFLEFDYCRWHMIPRRFSIYESNFRHIFRKFFYLITFYLSYIFWLNFYQFFVEGKLESLVGAFFGIQYLIFIFSFYNLFLDKYDIRWAKVFCLSLGALIISLSGALIAVFIWPKEVQFIFYGPSFDTLSIPLVIMQDLYFILIFIGTVLLKNVSMKAQIAIMGTYFIIYFINTYLAGSPILQMLGILLVVFYITDEKYSWIHRVIWFLKY